MSQLQNLEEIMSKFEGLSRLIIKKFLFAVTRPTQKTCPYTKIFIGLSENDFFLFFLFHVLRFSFHISSLFSFKMPHYTENML